MSLRLGARGIDKKGRPRHQKGYLFAEGGSWRGRYYIYRGKVRSRKSVTLGSIEEVTEEGARTALKEIILRENKQAFQGARIGHMSKAQLFSDERARKWDLGACAELLVAVDLSAKGYEIYRALSPQATCDLLAMRGGEIVRVEVKSTTAPATRPRIDIRDRIGRFDLLAVLFYEKTIIYKTHEEIKNFVYPVALDEFTGPVTGCEKLESLETKGLM